MRQEVSPSPRTKAGRTEWIGLGVIALACLLYVMDLSVLYLAVPSLTAHLHPSSTQLLWITDIYGFVVAGLLVTMGTLGDRIGRRRVLMWGAGLFGAASLVAAFSTSPGMLIASRALLGIGGATIAPSTLSLIRNMFSDPAERIRATSIWGTSFAAGGMIGPIIGGVVLEHFWWGSVFLINVPVMALLLILGRKLLPEYRDGAAGRVDVLSAAMSLVAVLAVIYGLKQIAGDGVSSTAVVSIAAGLAAGLGFIRRQRKLDDPLIDLELFRNRAFSVSVASNASTGFFSFGTFLFVEQYLQLVLGLSPVKAGLWSLPASAAVTISSNLAPRVSGMVRPAYGVAGGLGFAALGLGILTQVDPSAGLFPVVAGSVIFSLGLGPVFILATDLIMSSAPPERAGAASAISETGAEFGGALGVALLGSVGTIVYRSSIGGMLPAGLSQSARAAAGDTLGGALSAATSLPADLASNLITSARMAFTQGLRLSSAVGAVVAITIAAIVATKLRHIPRPESTPKETAEVFSEEGMPALCLT